jgi:hypothetical protein
MMKSFFSLRFFSIFFAVFFFTISITDVHASGAQRPKMDSESAEAEGQANITIPVVTPPEGGVQEPEKYAHIDPDKVVTSALLSKALSFYDANQKIIKNKRYIVVIDFKLHNSKKRFSIIDMESGVVEQHAVAHGKNSDTNFDGYATTFSNTNESLMSSVGHYLTAETYYGAHDYSLRLDGLSSTNSNARSRAIVIHGASYVNDGASLNGRSYGCPALDESISTQVIDMSTHLCWLLLITITHMH